MQEIGIFSPSIQKFLLVFLRAGVFVGMLPFFGSKNFPMPFKVGLAAALALMLTPVVQFEIADIPIALLVMRELALGLILGAAVRAVFFAVDMGGQMISNAMGLSIATIFNPEMGQSTEVARIYGIIAMLLMLAVDAHHDLITIFVRSYEWLPVGQVDVRSLLLKAVGVGSRVFIVALKISAPVLVGMLITQILLGFLYKAAPQINIFMVSFPVYIGIGFLIVLISIPVFAHVFTAEFNDLRDEMLRILAVARS
ncbi:MAG: flagellar biosynthetic protein FliR [Nitrospirales bacterium]|nr:flagellar biosynthetic protein FliR [Nitrospirales bacterium]